MVEAIVVSLLSLLPLTMMPLIASLNSIVENLKLIINVILILMLIR